MKNPPNKNSFITTLLHKFINKETITYIIFGILTTAVNYIAYFILYKFTALDALIYNTIAWAVSVIFAFITNKLFVFESKKWNARTVFKEFIPFVGARILSLLLEEAFLFITVEIANMHELIAKIIISVVVVIVNYFASKFFIFRNKKEEIPNG